MKIVKIGAIWCPGCLVMGKTWKEINSLYPNLDIETYDYDMDSEEVAKYNVGKILPVIIFFNNGEEFSRLNGEKKKEEIITVIEEIMNEKN